MTPAAGAAAASVACVRDPHGMQAPPPRGGLEPRDRRMRLRLRRGPPVAFLDSKKPGFRWGPSCRRFPRCQHSQRSAPLYEARRPLPSGSVARKERSFFFFFYIHHLFFYMLLARGASKFWNSSKQRPRNAPSHS